MPPENTPHPGTDYYELAMSVLRIDFYDLRVNIIRETFAQCRCTPTAACAGMLAARWNVHADAQHDCGRLGPLRQGAMPPHGKN